ncbi:MAG TPA: beta-galactosidase [bacterium]|nr:beta-galactosidase [bacterium]
MKILRLLLVLLFIGTLCFGWEGKFPGWQPYDKLPGALITPHIPFANPYYKGKLKVLVIAPAWTQRETVELAQRLSVEYTPLMTESYDFFGPYPGEGERSYYLTISKKEFEQLVNERLGDSAVYDLIIIGKIPWKVFPDNIKNQVLDKVKNGAGLLYVNPSDLPSEIQGLLKDNEPVKNRIVSGIPFKQIPLLADVSILSGEIEKGRIITITYAGDKTSKARGRVECLTPFEGDDPLYYDYYYSLIAKACLWAGKREPEVVFKSIPSDSPVVLRDNLTKTKISFTVEGKTSDVNSVSIFIRDRKNNLEYETAIPYRKSDISFSLPFLKSGEKILDVILKNNRGEVVNWVSTNLSVSSPVDIERVETDKEIYKKGDEIKGRVFLTDVLPEGAHLSVYIRDAFNRKVAEYKADGSGKEITFSFNIRYPLTYGYTLTAKLDDKTGTICEKDKKLYINITDFSKAIKDYSFIIWGGASDNSRSTRTYLQQFYNSGVDEIYVTSALWDNYEKSREIATRIADANLRSAPYTTRLFFVSNQAAHLKPIEGKDGLEIQNCPLSLPPEKIKNNSIIKHLRETIGKAYGALGASYYSLGDENALSFPYYDVCFCSNCQEGFRNYVKEMYKTIDALNNSWNTDYRDWSEVKGITLMDAYKQKRYPQWLDFRMFMDNVFSDFHITCARAIQEADPDAKVGLEGPVYPAKTGTGFNWYRMLPHMNFFGPYRNPIEVHAALSFMPEDKLITAWFGSYQGETYEQYMRFFPWAVLFEGMNAAAWWPSGVGGSAGLGGAAAYTPDFVPLEHFQWASEEIKEIKSGIGKLLISSERKLHPIGLYYSNACLHASTIRPEETTWELSLMDFHYVLRDGRYDYRYISPDDILGGKLSDISVLILPYAQAISLKEAEKIKDFVRQGGLLIADFVPGIMDEHGKKLEKSSLSSIFGDVFPSEVDVRSYGKGKAVYLGNYVKGYSEKRKRGEGKGICAGMVRFLTDLPSKKITPFADVTDSNGEIRQDVEVSLFENGQAKYITLIRSITPGPAVKAAGAEAVAVSGAVATDATSLVNVQIPQPSFIYDVRNKKFIGKTDKFTTTLMPSQANVFALLPAKLESMTLQMERQGYKKGDVVRFSVVLPEEFKDAGMCVRIEVYGPDGKIIPYYTRKLISSKGMIEGEVPLSLDEPSGNYKITATDVATSLTVSKTFSID